MIQLVFLVIYFYFVWSLSYSHERCIVDCLIWPENFTVLLWVFGDKTKYANCSHVLLKTIVFVLLEYIVNVYPCSFFHIINQLFSIIRMMSWHTRWRFNKCVFSDKVRRGKLWKILTIIDRQCVSCNGVGIHLNVCFSKVVSFPLKIHFYTRSQEEEIDFSAMVLEVLKKIEP